MSRFPHLTEALRAEAEAAMPDAAWLRDNARARADWIAAYMRIAGALRVQRKVNLNARIDRIASERRAALSCGVSEEAAQKIVLAIRTREIPHVEWRVAQ